MAQLGARLDGIEEVVGSNPIGSTNFVSSFQSDSKNFKGLVNRRLAYVALSRGRYDAQIYTNDRTDLAQGLERYVSHRSAMEPSRESVSPAREIKPSPSRSQVHEHSISR